MSTIHLPPLPGIHCRSTSVLHPIPSSSLILVLSNSPRKPHHTHNFLPITATSQVIQSAPHPKLPENSSVRVLQPWPHTVRKTHPCKYFATCPPGLEQAVAAELASPMIGASEIELGSGGVHFQGTISTGYNANLWLRCAIRVLIQLGEGEMPKRDRDCVYHFVRDAVDWPEYLASYSLKKSGYRKWRFRSFAVQSRVWDCKRVTNAMLSSTRAKDAICDAIRDGCNNRRPDPPEGGGANADVPLFLSLYKDYAVLYRDMSGISLHRRGYRDVMHRASLSESVAAGILTIAGWNTRVKGLGVEDKNEGMESLEDMVLLDPMCGSGTLLIEAALMAVNKAPGLMRTTWPFNLWHDFSSATWKECQEDASLAETAMPKGLRILGNDIHEGALSLCARNAEAAGVREALELSCKDCQEYIPSVTPSFVVVNPPWGFRLGNARNDNVEVGSPWEALGQFAKQHCNGADMYVFSGNSTVTRELHMKAARKWPITMGGIDCRLLHYYVLPPKVGGNTKYKQSGKISVKEVITR